MRRERLAKLALVALFATLVVIIEVEYAEPILDGDLFWHLAYARQMLTEHTLVPDATLYSWTPTDGHIIYCAWLAEFILYGIWKAFGLTGLFALRYLVIAAVGVLFWKTVRRARLPARPDTLLALLMLLTTATAGSIIKPELFSLLFFHCVLACYFAAKLAAREGRDPRPWLYSVPVLTLVWANTHGAFVFLALLLATTALGEVLNLRFSPRLAFSRRQLAHLGLAWSLCAVAICLTPYGTAYPLQLLTEFAKYGVARPDSVWNNAHLPIYAGGTSDVFSLVPDFAALALALLLFFVRVWRRGGRGAHLDYALVLGLIAYLPLSVQIVRTSYLWPALACYALVYLAYLGRFADAAVPPTRTQGTWRLKQALAFLAFAVVAARTVAAAYLSPSPGSWVGFGVSYVNPVPEAEYLARAKLGSRFYNTFDSGGYLLWRLYPQYRVMVDSRSYPYLDWFEDQFVFANGTMFDAFLARYPADVAVIDLHKVNCWRNFVRSRDWHLLFYGPTAAIFRRGPDKAGQVVEEAGELLHLRNADTAFSVFDFATVIGDYRTAWTILERLETTLSPQADATLVRRDQNFRAAHVALARHDYDAAASLFELALSQGVVADRDGLILSLLHSRSAMQRQHNVKGLKTVEASLAQLVVPVLPAQMDSRTSSQESSAPH